MAIEQKRIEAARDVIRKRIGELTFRFLTNDEAEALAAQVAEALYPELASDPPTGWVAPWMMTGDILSAAWRFRCVRDMDAADVGEMWAEMRDAQIRMEAFRAARDAHTKEQT